MPYKLNIAHADFETTPDEYNPLVWAWGVRANKGLLTKYQTTKYAYFNDKGDDTLIGHNIRTFIMWIFSLKEDWLIYFNNFQGFDAHFCLSILHDLKPYGIHYVPNIDNLNNELKPYYKECNNRIIRMKEWYQKKLTNDEIKKKWQHLMPGEFMYGTDEKYNITELLIKLQNYKLTNGKRKYRVVKIRCFLALFSTSVYNMGKTLNIANNSKIYSKGETPLDVLKPYETLNDLLAQKDKIRYLQQDTKITFEYDKFMLKVIPLNERKTTLAGTAQWVFMKMYGQKIIKKYNLKEIKLNNKFVKYRIPNSKKLLTEQGIGYHVFKKAFPTKWLFGEAPEFKYSNLHNYFQRNYYLGGLVQINERFRGMPLEATGIDINSSYPSVMNSDINIPYGKPHKGYHSKYPFRLFKITVKRSIINKYGLPFIRRKIKRKTQYPREIQPNGPPVYITSIEYQNFLRYYDIKPGDVDIEVEYSFKQMKINNLFKDFVNYFYNLKKNGTIAEIAFAKLMLNSLYGKFGMKVIREYREYINGSWTEAIQYITDTSQYLPLGFAITAMARMKLVNAAGMNWSDYGMYTDTDCLIVKNIDKFKDTIELDNHKLGAWKIEKTGTVIVRHTKQYAFFNDNKCVLAVYAGLQLDKKYDDKPIYESITKFDWLMGKTLPKQLQRKRLPTGIYLAPSDKSIKGIWEVPYLWDRTRLLSMDETLEYMYSNPQHFSKVGKGFVAQKLQIKLPKDAERYENA